MIHSEDVYISVMTIPNLFCSCRDAKKGTKKKASDWLKGNYSVIGNKELTINDIENTKYFIKLNGYTDNK